MTDTDTDTDAFEAMLAHHRSLEDQVARRVATLRAAASGDGAYEIAVAELAAYVAEEVLPHAIAEEHSVYQAAGGLPGLADTVSGMVAEHRQLAASVEALVASKSPADAAEIAESIAALFSAHVAKENDLLLPPLLVDASVSLSQLLVEMHRLTEAGSQPTDVVLDVRQLAPARRHESIFAAHAALLPGAGFVLVNDHDPKPLRYQFEAEHAGEFTWDYLERGPGVWRVRIGRPADAGA
ncbi:MAG: DUF2249 domain-containing protein [Acidimicrobiales bacterium]